MTAHQRRTAIPIPGAAGLTTSGIAAALAIGAAALVAGVRWVVVLLVFFVAATAATRYRREEKLRRAGSVIERTGARTAAQVLANGSIFAAGAVVFALSRDPLWAAFAFAALAAASADTWATELGLLSSSIPRSIVSGERVAPGTSGGVTLAGTGAGVLGALVVSFTAYTLGWREPAFAALLGGLGGMTADSLLGALVQERRWCPRCARETERSTHGCGTETGHSRGLRGVGNDAVNAIATLIGGAIGAAVLAAAR